MTPEKEANAKAMIFAKALANYIHIDIKPNITSKTESLTELKLYYNFKINLDKTTSFDVYTDTIQDINDFILTQHNIQKLTLKETTYPVTSLATMHSNPYFYIIQIRWNNYTKEDKTVTNIYTINLQYSPRGN